MITPLVICHGARDGFIMETNLTMQSGSANTKRGGGEETKARFLQMFRFPMSAFSFYFLVHGILATFLNMFYFHFFVIVKRM